MPKGYTYGKLGSSGPGPYRPHAGWRNNRPPGLEATVRRGAHVGWHRNEGSCLQAEGRGPCEDRIRQLSTSGVNKRNLTSSRLTIRIDHRSYYECPRASRSSHLAPHSTWSEAHRSVSRLGLVTSHAAPRAAPGRRQEQRRASGQSSVDKGLCCRWVARGLAPNPANPCHRERLAVWRSRVGISADNAACFAIVWQPSAITNRTARAFGSSMASACAHASAARCSQNAGVNVDPMTQP